MILDLIEQHERELLSDIAFWKHEAEEWKTKYTDLLNSSIKHGEAMFGLVLKAALDKGETSA